MVGIICQALPGGAGCPFICKMLSTFQDPWAVYIVLERGASDLFRILSNRGLLSVVGTDG